MSFFESGFFDPGFIEPPPGTGTTEDVIAFVCVIAQNPDLGDSEIAQTPDLGEVEF